MNRFFLALFSLISLSAFANVKARWVDLKAGGIWQNKSSWGSRVIPEAPGDTAIFKLDSNFAPELNVTIINEADITTVFLSQLLVDLTDYDSIFTINGSFPADLALVFARDMNDSERVNGQCVIIPSESSYCRIFPDIQLIIPTTFTVFPSPTGGVGLSVYSISDTKKTFESGIMNVEGGGVLDFHGNPCTFNTLNVNQATVQINNSSSAPFAVNQININGGVVQSLNSNQFQNDSGGDSNTIITLNSGRFESIGLDQSIKALTYNGGNFVMVEGILTLLDTDTALTMGSTSLDPKISLPSNGTTIRFNGSTGRAKLPREVILNGGTTTFDINNGSSFPDMLVNTISGTGNIVKSGEGSLQLAGRSNYLGNTTVNQGALIVSGTVSGDTTINSNGSLFGTGTLENLTNKGIVSPGRSIGTLNVTESYMQSTGGNLEIELNDSLDVDLLNISGVASLDGFLTVLPEPGVYQAGQRYVFVNYLSHSGSLMLVDNSGLDFAVLLHPAFGELVNDLSGVILQLSKEKLSGNALAVADYIACPGFFPDNLDLLNVIRSLLKVPADQFPEDLVKLSPVQFGALPLVSLETHSMVSDLIVENTEKLFWCDPCASSQADEKSCKQNRKETAVWVAPIGNYYHQDGITHGSSKSWADRQIPFDAYSIGAGLGASHLFFDSLSVGGGIGYVYSHIDWEKNRGGGHSNSVYLGSSIGWNKSNGHLNFLLLGSINRHHTDRKIKFFDVNRTAESTHNSYDLLLRLDGGYKFQIQTGGSFDHFFILPEATISYFNVFEDSFTESGAGTINLDVDSKYSAFLQPAVSVKFLKDFYSSGICLTPALQIGWTSNVPLSSGNYTSRFYKQNTCQSNFTVKSFHDTTNQMTLGGELVITTDSNWTVELGYKADLFDSRSVQTGKVKVERRF